MVLRHLDGHQDFETTAQDLARSEEHTSELQSQSNLVCRLLLEKKKKKQQHPLGDHLGVTPDATASRINIMQSSVCWQSLATHLGHPACRPPRRVSQLRLRTHW